MTRLSIVPLMALMFSGVLESGLNWVQFARMNERALSTHVGAVAGKCCLTGRRWGCDPGNFGQSGCTGIGGSMFCQRRQWATMKCTAAECQPSNPEHKCEVDIKTVRHNRCRPTGRATTAGCPEDEWQCEVEMRAHTIPTNPTSDVLVCDDKVSTLCGASFAPCD